MKLFQTFKSAGPNRDPYYDYYPKKTGPVELDFHNLFVAPTKEIYTKLIAFIPDLLSAFYILILGWIIAHILKFIVSTFFKAIRFDKIADQTGLQELINAGEKKTTATKWFSALTYWVTIFVTWAMALEQLRLRIASNGLNQLMFMLSVVVGAVIVLTLGMFLSVLIRRIVETVGTKLNVPSASKYAAVMQGMILFFTSILVLAQFNIPPEFIFIVLCVISVTLCITFILAFGIGGREWGV